MSRLTNAVDVANAALMEVGLDPVCWGEDGHVYWPDTQDHQMRYRAGLLGLLATEGPAARCCCTLHSNRLTGPPAPDYCMTVADALRGLPCEAP